MRGREDSGTIMLTSPCNVDPLRPHFYIVKMGCSGVYTIFVFLLLNKDCEYSLLKVIYEGLYSVKS